MLTGIRYAFFLILRSSQGKQSQARTAGLLADDTVVTSQVLDVGGFFYVWNRRTLKEHPRGRRNADCYRSWVGRRLRSNFGLLRPGICPQTAAHSPGRYLSAGHRERIFRIQPREGRARVVSSLS